MKKIMVKLLLVMTLAFPVFVQAQDATEVPPTVEVLETPTEVPTETATPAPTEVPAPVPPPPIDQTKVFESIFTVVMVLIVGAVAIGLLGIASILLILSPPVRAIVMGTIKTGVDEAGKIADKTETPIDDLAVSELRKLIERLERELNRTQAELRATQGDVAANTQAIAVVTQNK